MVNKKGWIRIVEAFVGILIIAAVMLATINSGYIEKIKLEKGIYNDELAILQSIELNFSLRQEILNPETLPVEWVNFPEKIKTKIENQKPDYLDCEAKICGLDSSCILSSDIEKNIYAKAVVISATLTKYSPRQIKLFCWEI